MRTRLPWWSLPVLAICAGAPGAACADDAQSQDALVGKLMPPDGPDVLNFRGVRLHSITLRPSKAQATPVAEFDIEFGAHATQLSARAKELILAHRADFAAAPSEAGRFVIASGPDAGGTPEATRGESEKRADTVRDYIVKEFGVDPARIEIAASGADAADGPANPQSGGDRRVHVAKYAQ